MNFGLHSYRVIGGLRAATLVPETRPWGRKVNLFGDKEAGDELRFFRERDAENLRNLLKKVTPCACTWWS